MPRLNRFQIIRHMTPLIVQHLKELNKNVFSLSEMKLILSKNREKWTIPKITKANEFIDVLKDKGVIEEVVIDTPQREITKYIFGEASPYDIALSIRRGSYLSHYSAVFSHQLTENVPKTIYTNVEQSPKYTADPDEELQQEDIDLAFSRPMRLTNQIATFSFRGKEYKVYLLNGKNHNRLGVERIQTFNLSKPSYITNIERTLIDIVVRPAYSGGVEEVLQAFKEAKGKYSVNRMLSYLKKMEFRYPYHQLIGFYLEKAGYEEKVLNLLNKFEIKYNFYLTYQISEKEFSERWRVYYPKGL
jgi:predicted transcriptional regulator of viral defense system